MLLSSIACQISTTITWTYSDLLRQKDLPPRYLWSCHRSQTRYPTTLGPDISVITETARRSSEIPWRYAQTRKDFPHQVPCGRTNPFCTKTRPSLTASCRLLRFEQGYSAQQIPHPLNDRIERSGLGSDGVTPSCYVRLGHPCRCEQGYWPDHAAVTGVVW